MSDSETYDELTVSTDGVTVTKRFEADEFPVPAIAFEFESARDETVTVRLSDTVPDAIEVEDLGFHPEYGSEYWVMDEETITFERDLDPNAEYTTVYGIRATGSDDIDQFLTEPELENVDPPLPHENVVPGSNDDVVEDALADGSEIPALEEDEEEPAADEEEVETLDLEDPSASAEPDDGETTADEASASALEEDEDLVGALASQIRNGAVSSDDLAVLQEALGATDASVDDSGSSGARLDQIQRDVSDLRAYTTALEEFLDENGTGQEIIDGFEERLDDVEEHLSTVDSTFENVRNELDTVDAELEQVSDELEDRVTDVESELDTLRDELNTVNEDVADVTDELSGLDDAVTAVTEQVEELESQVTEEDVVEQVANLESAVEDLQDWQEQIKQTFGGG